MREAPEDTPVRGVAFTDVGGDGLAAAVRPVTAESPAEGVRRWLPGLKVLQDLIELEDVAWVTKAQDGKMQLHQGTYLAGADAAAGTMWDFLFGLLFLVPIFGTASGAGAGKLSDYGIDETWIHQAAGAIPFGGSALFVMARNSNAARAVPEMAKFDGRMFRRFLTSRQQQALENAAQPIG